LRWRCLANSSLLVSGHAAVVSLGLLEDGLVAESRVGTGLYGLVDGGREVQVGLLLGLQFAVVDLLLLLLRIVGVVVLLLLSSVVLRGIGSLCGLVGLGLGIGVVGGEVGLAVGRVRHEYRVFIVGVPIGSGGFAQSHFVQVGIHGLVLVLFLAFDHLSVRAGGLLGHLLLLLLLIWLLLLLLIL